MTTKITWKLINYIVKLAHESDAIIFGGFLRDQIIHNYYARKFYQDSLIDNTKYDDKTYAPHLIDRLLIPRDIDLYINNNNISIFENKLIDLGFSIKKKNNCFSNYSLNELLLLSKFELTINKKKDSILKVFSSILKNFTYNIDIIHSDEPHGYKYLNYDFECNGLMLTKDNQYLLSYEILINQHNLSPDNKQLLIQKIFDDIINYRAILVKNSDNLKYRIHHMLYKKKWNINSTLLISSYHDILPDKDCIICHEEITYFSLKTKCCNAFYHHNCFKEMNENLINEICPQCRKPFNLTIIDRQLI
jgi:hypothetical protein